MDKKAVPVGFINLFQRTNRVSQAHIPSKVLIQQDLTTNENKHNVIDYLFMCIKINSIHRRFLRLNIYNAGVSNDI
jgi:hypothetical protein